MSKEYYIGIIIGLFVVYQSMNLPDKIYADEYENTIMFVQNDTVPEEENCLECHANLMEESEQHNPAKKQCSRCHKTNGEEHPLENVVAFRLDKEVPDLCYECHLPKNDEDFVHKPVGEGKCTMCHSPHSSPNLYLVKEDPVSNLCLKCHDLHIPEGNKVHQAVLDGNCQGCHNPHQADNEKFLATTIQSRLCMGCHREIRSALKEEHVHPPFKSECLSCHKPHSSTDSHLLDSKPKELCLSCHEDLNKTLAASSYVHGALDQNESCLNCHSPHSSEREKILISDDRTLCLTCHNKPIKTASGSIKNIGFMLKEGNAIHGAVTKEGCTFCHKGHTSEEHSLLAFAFPSGNYAPADADNFDLCFQCHDKKLITEEITNTATNFRNDERNLHVVHINGPKGRKCTLCHNVHGAANDHLIDDKVTFGNWNMPINYVKNEKGGSCSPGCHEKRQYERVAFTGPINIIRVFSDSVSNKKKGEN